MKELLSRIGIGAAKVDTVLPKREYRLGETVEARVDVVGGDVAQDVDDIYLALMTLYKMDEGYGHGVIEKFHTAEEFTIQPQEERSVDVTFTIPYTTPLSIGRTQVWLKTGLDVDWALDPKDDDTITVEPDERISALLEAVSDMGFHMRGTECERGSWKYGRPFVQEFEFKPSRPRGKLKELEIMPLATEDEVRVIVEVDRKMGGLAGALGGESEQKRSFAFQGVPSQAELQEKIERLLPDS